MWNLEVKEIECWCQSLALDRSNLLVLAIAVVERYMRIITSSACDFEKKTKVRQEPLKRETERHLHANSSHPFARV
jgi:hypothetical protein